MDNDTYDKFWIVFEAKATTVLSAVRQLLIQGYGIDVGEVELIDHDEERGYGFTVWLDGQDQGGLNNDLFIEWMLTDGDATGFGPEEEGGPSQVGLHLTMSDRDNQEMDAIAPYNFTPEVGTSDVSVLASRIDDFFAPQDLARRVMYAWERAFAKQADPGLPSIVPYALMTAEQRTAFDLRPGMTPERRAEMEAKLANLRAARRGGVTRAETTEDADGPSAGPGN